VGPKDLNNALRVLAAVQRYGYVFIISDTPHCSYTKRKSCTPPVFHKETIAAGIHTPHGRIVSGTHGEGLMDKFT
jgi:hypothetical protein